ncbi:3-deoxy-D-manno-octulosonic acid transferase [Segatella copri]|uniref:3-deoxy-D-manno-octulosonic acid transferase n=1 Tax=Segatella copri TaxID=165179 RepID=UPI00058C49C7|nr:glycosyltransferase N-terminal domain-containing protein [Segatella copri]MCW4097382.1 3-deoxy-D-manno-octulosonic acid transferase [Segatella copri]MQP18554.1 3-deoxy-D-manno-octulosonic acid transferase [Segatella copri DSM 18205]UEA44371.1 3-deoxy-D-manno-octulosonic acid transferase [Segatella copri DSM 18205]UWP53743.1 3-deoxy-D-manno-octulosonic acid transferase [Segatella copri DSM 18205]
MYNIVIYFVLWGIAIASLFNEKVRKMWRGEREAFKILKQKVDPNAKYIWFHAASLGEFEQGRPLMERIRKDYPQYKILLTFYSPSGYEVRKNYEGADIICYMPVDTRLNAIRFLRLVRPVMAFFIKYEFWSNFLHILKHRNIPTYSVSSIFREDQVFFKWYGRSYAGVLKCFTRFFVQNEESKRLLEGIGITAVDVVGDTRFDRVLQIKEAAKHLPICEAFRTGVASSQSADVPHHDFKVFVAGSSWPPDENIFIPFFNEHKDWRLLIAPHVIAEEHLKLILSLIKGKKVVRYTQTTPEEAAEADVLIIDCFGLLSSMYNYGDVAYIGGGFGVGIHNTLEAAVWNMPVIFGPNNKKFQEAQGLLKSGGGFEINTYEDFSGLMSSLMNDETFLKQAGDKAGTYVAHLAGATDKVLASVKL